MREKFFNDLNLPLPLIEENLNRQRSQLTSQRASEKMT